MWAAQGGTNWSVQPAIRSVFGKPPAEPPEVAFHAGRMRPAHELLNLQATRHPVPPLPTSPDASS